MGSILKELVLGGWELELGKAMDHMTTWGTNVMKAWLEKKQHTMAI
jgi:hypothetical protein